MKLVKEAGLHFHLRIGPYACAEWNFGGFPVWLKYVHGIRFRTDNEPFKSQSTIGFCNDGTSWEAMHESWQCGLEEQWAQCRMSDLSSEQWAQSAFVVIHLIVFLVAMAVNPVRSAGDCGLPFLGRFSFQLLSKEPPHRPLLLHVRLC